MSRSAVLSKSHPSSLQLVVVADPTVDHRRRKRRYKFLVLAMTIYHPFYFMFLNCCLVFDKISPRTSNSLVVVVVKDILERIKEVRFIFT